MNITVFNTSQFAVFVIYIDKIGNLKDSREQIQAICDEGDEHDDIKNKKMSDYGDDDSDNNNWEHYRSDCESGDHGCSYERDDYDN